MSVVAEPQHTVALGKAQSVRAERAKLRGRIAHGDKTALRELYLNPPAFARTLMLYEPLEWAPGISQKKLTLLNKAAIRDGINLMMPFAWAGSRSRMWVLANLRIWRTGQVSLNTNPIAWDDAGVPVADQPPAELLGGFISNGPLRDAVTAEVQRRGISWAQAGALCGWYDRTSGDGSRLRRALGICRRSGARTVQSSIRADTAVTIASAFNLTDQEAGLV